MSQKEIEISWAGTKEVSNGIKVSIKSTSEEWFGNFFKTQDGAEKWIEDNGVVKGAVGIVDFKVNGEYNNINTFALTQEALHFLAGHQFI